MPEVYVPDVLTQLTTTSVMTMEWIEGERLRTASSSANVSEGMARIGGSADDLTLVEVWTT